MHRQAVAVLCRAAQRVDVVQVELGVHTLGEQVEGQGHHVHVAGTFPVAEQGALHPVGPRQLGQLCCGHRGSTVVVGVHAEGDRLAAADLAPEPLDHVRVGVGPVHLDRVGKVEDHRSFSTRLDHIHDCLADLDCEVGLGAGEAFR